MTYNVEAARAERAAQRSSEPFRFELDGRTWTMKSIDDVPAGFLAWSAADYSRQFGRLIVEDDFTPGTMTVGDMNALVAAWLGSTPGE